jgi:predicted RNA-binding Zn-ribbon protein involved in translation (DUF1610 family)
MTHKHRCRKCRTIWQHGKPRMTKEQVMKAQRDPVFKKQLLRDTEHECPACGEPEFAPYAGSRKAQFQHTHTRTRRLNVSRRSPMEKIVDDFLRKRTRKKSSR